MVKEIGSLLDEEVSMVDVIVSSENNGGKVTVGRTIFLLSILDVVDGGAKVTILFLGREESETSSSTDMDFSVTSLSGMAMVSSATCLEED